MKKERHKMGATVYGIIIRDGKILLSLRENTGYKDGYYGVIAGKVEAGETIDEAMVRELKEEIDITVKPESLELVTTKYHLGDEEHDDYMDFYFIVKDYEGKIHNNEPHKCGGLEFFDLDKIPTNIVSYVGKAISDTFSGRKYESILIYD